MNSDDAVPERRCPICSATEYDVIADGCPAADEALEEGERDCLLVRLEEARRP